MTTFIALLRGINVGGKNKIAMADLRQLCESLGYRDVQTYIQSGNVVFTGTDAAAIESTLERAIAAHFGLAIPVIARTAQQWPGYLKCNPFLAVSQREPNHLLMGLSKSRPAQGAVAALCERAARGELVEIAGDALWIFYAGGVARSKLSPALIDRVVGSSVTARNWRTVQQLAAMVE
jgi:uncharacterized protein (DUF1697 family)